VAALALSTLCVQWGLSERYRENILRGLRGLEWDDLDDVRDAAITAAGAHLRTHTDGEMLTELMKFADDVDRPLELQFAIEALARALAGRARRDRDDCRDCTFDQATGCGGSGLCSRFRPGGQGFGPWRRGVDAGSRGGASWRIWWWILTGWMPSRGS
jgi:hypothetical protein